MRHRDDIFCGDAEKAHLHRLPNFEAHEVPPKIGKPSKTGVVIIPLFAGQPNSDGSPGYSGAEFSGCMSALWARRSWLLNSDAMDYSIDVKIYMEKHFRQSDAIMSILKQNRATEEDIIWFDGSALEGAIPVKGGYLSAWAKKCVLWADKQLQGYEWIFEADSDLFIMKHGDTCLPFFYEFFKKRLSYNLMSFSIGTKPKDPPYRTAERLLRVGLSSFEAWKEDFENLLGQDMLDRYCNPDRWFMVPHNPLHVFPARHLMQERWTDCELLIKIARIMLSDEQTLSVWHSMGNDMYDLREVLDNCPMISNPNSGTVIDEIHRLSIAWQAVICSILERARLKLSGEKGLVHYEIGKKQRGLCSSWNWFQCRVLFFGRSELV